MRMGSTREDFAPMSSRTPNRLYTSCERGWPRRHRQYDLKQACSGGKCADLDANTPLADVAYLFFFLDDAHRDAIPAQRQCGNEPGGARSDLRTSWSVVELIKMRSLHLRPRLGLRRWTCCRCASARREMCLRTSAI